MKFKDPSTGVEVECTTAEYAELAQFYRTGTPATRVANSELSEGYDPVMRLTRKQLTTYEAIRDLGPISTTQLAEYLSITPSAATARYQALVKQGVRFVYHLPGTYEIEN